MSRLFRLRKEENLVSRESRKFNQVSNVQQWINKPMQTKLYQVPFTYNLFGRPLKQSLSSPQIQSRILLQSIPNYQLIQSTVPNGQIRSRIWSSRIKRMQRKPVRPFQTNKQQRTRIGQSKSIQQHQRRVRFPQTNQQQKNRVKAFQLIQQQRGRIRPTESNQQQINRVRVLQLIQQQRGRTRPTEFNQLQRRNVRPTRPHLNIRRMHPEKRINRIKIFTPQELLLFAPKQDKVIWGIIVNRLPHDYSIPDPQFLQVYELYNNNQKR
jgi:hypothetical protein